MKLYGYWRSSCSWRVRIALALKGLDYTAVPVHLTRDGGEQHGPTHRQRNPMGQVPVLELVDGRHLSQSLAILDYLEEAYPTPALLPEDRWARARCRQLAETINAGVQPLQNLAVMQRLKDLGVDPTEWSRHFITTGLDALEAAVDRTTGPFLAGDAPSWADLCLVPQLYNARRVDCDTSRWPRLCAAERAALAVPAFHLTHPDHQPDAARAA